MVDACKENSAIKSHLQLVGGWTCVPVSQISNKNNKKINYFHFGGGKEEGQEHGITKQRAIQDHESESESERLNERVRE